MRKILSFFALAAVLLGMASCNNEDVNLKRFKMTVEDITPLSAHITITPPDEQMDYTYMLVNNATFNWFKAKEDGLKGALSIFVEIQGTSDHMYELFPNTKFVMCAGEKDPEDSYAILGEVEYTRFQTPGMQPKATDFVEEGESLPMEGECYFYPEQKDLMCIYAQYPIPGSDGEGIVLYLFFVSEKLTGHMTTDDLFAYLFLQSHIEVVDVEGNQQEAYSICGADLKGSFNDVTGKFEYKGWCDLLSEDKELFRLPVVFECTEWVDEESDDKNNIERQPVGGIKVAHV